MLARGPVVGACCVEEPVAGCSDDCVEAGELARCVVDAHLGCDDVGGGGVEDDEFAEGGALGEVVLGAGVGDWERGGEDGGGEGYGAAVLGEVGGWGEEGGV